MTKRRLPGRWVEQCVDCGHFNSDMGTPNDEWCDKGEMPIPCDLIMSGIITDNCPLRRRCGSCRNEACL